MQSIGTESAENQGKPTVSGATEPTAWDVVTLHALLEEFVTDLGDRKALERAIVAELRGCLQARRQGALAEQLLGFLADSPLGYSVTGREVRP